MGGNLSICDHRSLTKLGMSSLSSVGLDFRIQDNSILPTCEAEALRDQVQNAGGIGGTVTISGNDDTGTCP